MAAAVVIAGAMLAYRLIQPAYSAYADTFQYVREALWFAGTPRYSQVAAEFHCRQAAAQVSAQDWQNCLDYLSRLDRVFGPRYVAIFTARPGYALVLVPFVLVLGPIGAAIGTWFVFVALGVTFYLAVRVLGGGVGTGLVAETLLLALPSGYWSGRLLSEGTMLLCIAGSLLGLGTIMRGRRLGGGLLLGGCAFFGYLTRPQNSLSLTVMFLAGALIAAARGRTQRRGHLTIAGVCATALAGIVVYAAVRHPPGLTEMLQLQASDTFTRPDVANPWLPLLHEEQGLVSYFYQRIDAFTPMLLVIVAALVGAFRASRTMPWAWTAVAVSAVVSGLAYPDISTQNRLTVAIWMPVAAGIAHLITARRPAVLPHQSGSPSSAPHHEERPGSSAATNEYRQTGMI